MLSWLRSFTTPPVPEEDPFVDWDTKDMPKELDKMKETISQNCNTEPLRIILCGTSGAGKSSFVNNIVSSLRGKVIQVANCAEDKGHITQNYAEYTILRSATNTPILVVCDTLGMYKSGQEDHAAAVRDALRGRYASNETMDIAGATPMEGGKAKRKQAVYVVFVVSATEAIGTSHLTRTSFETMVSIQTFAHKASIPMCVVVTKCDLLDEEVGRDMTKLYKSKIVDTTRRTVQEKFRNLPKYRIFPFVNNTSGMELGKPLRFHTLYVLKHIVSDVESYMCDFVHGVPNTTSNQQ